MDHCLALAKYFSFNPLPSFLIATALLAGYLARRILRALQNPPRISATPLLVAAAAWFLFALNEHYAKLNGINIRIDLFLIWPAIWTLTAICVYLAIISLWRLERPES